MKIKGYLKRVVKLFKKYFSTNILFSSYLIISILLSLTLRILTVGISFSIKPIIYDLFISLIIGSFGYLFKPRNQFKYFFSVLSIFTFLCIINSLYYTFYKSFLSISLIESMVMLKDVKSSVFDKLRLIHFAYVIYIFLFSLIHKKLSKRKYYFEIEKIEISSKMFKNTLFVGIVIMLISILMITRVDVSKMSRNWNREYVMQKFGLYTYTINDFIQSLKPKIDVNIGYDAAAYEFREFYKKEFKNRKKETNKYTGIFEGKNLLVIHAESIQNFLIDLKINGKEVTPNLNKLSKKGLYFNKFYPQITTGTSSDTEFTFETGLLPSTSGITFVSYFDRKYESISNKFNSLGYYTFSMHANDGDYWNRNTMYKTFGYNKFYSKNSYVVSDNDIIGLGLSDKEFFKQSTILLKGIKASKEPFYGKIITLTNHSPFDQIDKYDDFDLTLSYEFINDQGRKVKGTSNYLEGREMGNYLKSAHYADAALGEFFELLEENGILENTVIVLYGDHEARIPKSEFNYMYNYNPVTDSIMPEDDERFISFENYKYDLIKNTPLIIWDNELKYSETIEDVMGMYDLFPTLANMFSFNYKYSMGKDIFSNSEKIVIFPNGNFLTNKIYYNNLKGDYVTLTDEPISEGYIERLKDYSEIRLSVSNNIIIHDLIRKEEENIKK